MDYRKFNGAYIIRLDIGDEIVECLKAFCQDNQIKLGTIIGIGTTNSAQVGILETGTKEYHPKAYTGDMEITSLTGTITRMNGETYLHIHANMALMDHTVIGGHLDYAVVSAVAEIIIQSIDGIVEREYSDIAGVNLLQFN
jgi:predicted DNA-binding protein with PD1-like motif